MIPDAWAALRGLTLRAAPDAGLINETLVAGDPPRFAVQRVNAIFSPRVHEDIDAVTRHIAAKGMVTPRLVPTDGGELWATGDDGAIWRVLDWVPGRTLHRVTDPGVAARAATLVARFHGALADLEWTYRSVRAGAHDTVAHLARLEEAACVVNGARTELELRAAAVADGILGEWSTWSGRLDLPARHAHGDLKISNIRFAPDGSALCLLDLDTLGRLSVDVELGDAWRSWCNPVGEDSTETTFDLAVFAASAGAYLETNPLAREEREALVAGIERIALELAARFCLDVFEDRYFGWDPARFPSRPAHDLFRAQGQLALARSVRGRRTEAERLVLG